METIEIKTKVLRQRLESIVINYLDSLGVSQDCTDDRVNVNEVLELIASYQDEKLIAQVKEVLNESR